ncbi:MAG: lysostaphin resistance A-like protein [Erysipelotrichaceae bacterium]
MDNREKGVIILGLYFGFAQLILPTILFIMLQNELALQVSVSMVTLLVVWIVCRNKIKDDFKRIKHSDLLIKTVIYTALMLVYVVIVSLIIALIIGDNIGSMNQVQLELIFAGNELLLIFTTVLLAPFIEEIVFRLAVDWLVGTNAKKYIYYILSGLLFGLMHIIASVVMGNFIELIYLFIYSGIGVILAHIYLKHDRNIFYPIAIHALYNGIQVCLMIISQ